jgi:hypothetical protein
MSFDYNTIGASWASVWNELDEGARVATKQPYRQVRSPRYGGQRKPEFFEPSR